MQVPSASNPSTGQLQSMFTPFQLINPNLSYMTTPASASSVADNLQLALGGGMQVNQLWQ